MHRRISFLVGVLALLTAWQLSSLTQAPSASAADGVCPTTVHLPARPGAVGPQHVLMAVGRSLADRGRLDAAQRLFDLARTSTPADPAARAGLAYVEARRAAAADAARDGQRLAARNRSADSAACFAQALTLDAANSTALSASAVPAASASTRAEKGAQGWDAFYKGWVDPTVRVGLPAVAVLVVLLALARLLTPLAVPASVTAWPDPWPQRAWRAGLLLLAAAAAGAVAVAAYATGGAVPRIWLAVPVLVGALAVAGALLLLRRARGGGRWLWSLAQGIAVVGAVVALVLALRRDAVPGAVVWWTVVAAAACLGLPLVAAGRGHPLRLQVTVKQSDGNDADGTAYVLGRLQELGSSPPQGLKTPQLVDVNDLPSAALSALPAGRLAAALAPVLQLLTPSTPWRATVQDGLKDELVLVTLTRNGSTARTALVDPTRFLPKPADGAAPVPGTVARGDLLTAAAAVILTELAIRHDGLKEGLCGATRWDSVAAYVVATKPPASAGGAELRRELLAYAVQADPGNSFAQLAYAYLLGEDASTIPERRAHIQRLDRVRTLIDTEAQDRRGYLALRLRTLHTLAAAQLNLGAAETGTARASAAQEASRTCTAFEELAARPAPWADPGQSAFLSEMHLIAGQLRLAVDALLQTGCPPSDGAAPVVPPAQGTAATTTPSLHVLYDEACRLALLGIDPKVALDDLEMAAGLEDLRRHALGDPWFDRFRTSSGSSPEDQERFWRIVGAPVPAFTDLPPFGTKGAALRAIGIATPEDLLAAIDGADGPAALAKSLDLSERIVRGWRNFAELAGLDGPPGPHLDGRELALLAFTGIRTRATLVGQTAAADLAAALTATAIAHRLRPPSLAEVETWLEISRRSATAEQAAQPVSATGDGYLG